MAINNIQPLKTWSVLVSLKVYLKDTELLRAIWLRNCNSQATKPRNDRKQLWVTNKWTDRGDHDEMSSSSAIDDNEIYPDSFKPFLWPLKRSLYALVILTSGKLPQLFSFVCPSISRPLVLLSANPFVSNPTILLLASGDHKTKICTFSYASGNHKSGSLMTIWTNKA